jgi:hypothetical protein
MTGRIASLGRLARRLVAARRATIPIEMALVAPVLITMLLGVLDLGWYMVMQHKISRVAATVADLTSRGEEITEAQLADIFAAASAVADPFDFDLEGRAIVSSLTNPDGDGAVIAWQRRSPSGIDVESHLGTAGSTPALDAGFAVAADENIVVAESFFTFEPLVGFILRDEQSVYVQAIQRPRLGTLDQVLP